MRKTVQNGVHAGDRVSGRLPLSCVAVCRFAAGGVLCLSGSGAADLPVMIPAGWWRTGQGGSGGGGGGSGPGGKLEDGERPAVPDSSGQLPPTARRHGGKTDGKKKKEGAMDLREHVSSMRQSIVEMRRGQN